MTRKQIDTLKEQAKRSGARALQEFGYPHCTPENICSDFVYGMAFLPLLRETKEVAATFRKDTTPLDELIAEVESFQKAHAEN